MGWLGGVVLQECVVVGVWALLDRPLFLPPLPLSKPCEASLVDMLLLLDTFDEVLVGNVHDIKLTCRRFVLRLSSGMMIAVRDGK